MSGLSLDQRPDEAVFWPRPLNDGYPVIGPSDSAARVIFVRWQDQQQMFRDTEGRERLSNAVIYSAEQLEIGGSLLLADQINVLDVAEYPPVTPFQIEEFLEYYKFDDDLTGENGNDLSVDAGAIGFDTGVSDQALYSDGNTMFTLSSDSDYAWEGTDEMMVTFWIKNDISTVLNDQTFSILLTNNMRIDIDAGSLNTIKFGSADMTKQSVFSGLAPDWLDEDWVHLAFVYKKDVAQDIYINGLKVTLTSQSGIYDADFIDGDIEIDNLISVNRDTWIDELRFYKELIPLKALQKLAAIHPKQYDSFEVRNNGFSKSLDGEEIIYKAWLNK